MNAPAKIGDNRPALIRAEDLAHTFDHASKAIGEIEAKVAEAPPVLEDDEDLGIVSEIMKKLNGAAKRVEELRVTEKEPYLAASRVVDGFFKGFSTRVDKAKADLQKRMDSYMRKKAEAERKRREAEEQRAREEAERQRQAVAAAESEQAKIAAIEAAAEAEIDAKVAAMAAQAKPSDMVRTHTEAGVTATAEEVWTFEIQAPAMIDLDMLRPYIDEEAIHKALRRFVGLYKNTKPMPGVRIFPILKTRVR